MTLCKWLFFWPHKWSEAFVIHIYAGEDPIVQQCDRSGKYKWLGNAVSSLLLILSACATPKPCPVCAVCEAPKPRSKVIEVPNKAVPEAVRGLFEKKKVRVK